MRVHHLDCGSMNPLGGRLALGGGAPAGSARMVCHSLLVEAPRGLILVDGGFGLSDVAAARERLGLGFLAVARPRLDERETALRQLEALGHRARDVRHIVLTHLDLDHAGALADFPDAEVHVAAAEHAAALAPATSSERMRYRQAQFAHGPRFVLHEPRGESWRGFEAVHDVAGLPELLMVPLAGHTRGHSAVALDTGSGWLLHAGDAYFHRDEVHAPRPRCPAGLALFQRLVATDDRARRANQGRLVELRRDSGADLRVFSAHDPVELDAARAAAAESALRTAHPAPETQASPA